MTSPPPAMLDNAVVSHFADISDQPVLGTTVHVGQTAPFTRLALASYGDGDGVHLFYCDEDWNVLNDTFHSDVGAASAQAVHEFGDIVFTPRVA